MDDPFLRACPLALDTTAFQRGYQVYLLPIGISPSLFCETRHHRFKNIFYFSTSDDVAVFYYIKDANYETYC